MGAALKFTLGSIEGPLKIMVYCWFPLKRPQIGSHPGSRLKAAGPVADAGEHAVQDLQDPNHSIPSPGFLISGRHLDQLRVPMVSSFRV